MLIYGETDLPMIPDVKFLSNYRKTLNIPTRLVEKLNYLKIIQERGVVMFNMGGGDCV